MIGIYKITNPVGQIYIGQSKNLDKRIKEHKGFYKGSKHHRKLYKSLVEFNVDAHLFEVIELCELHKLNERERHYQEVYDAVDNGLNCEYTQTELKAKIRDQQSRINIAIASTGRWHTEEAKKAISKKRTGMKFTKEHCENIRLSKTGANNAVSKKVKDLSTNTTYESVAEAAFINGLNVKTLSKYLLGTRTNKTTLVFASNNTISK